MKAIGQNIYGGPEVLEFMDVPGPVPKKNDLLVKVRAFAVNPVDKNRRQGQEAGEPVPHPPQIIG